MLQKINLAEKFTRFRTQWDPKIIGELNGQYVKLARIQGEFIWHQHDNEDELFMVVEGSFNMLLRDGAVPVHQGELIIIPRGVEHCPAADSEALILLFEPKSVVNTGDKQSERTVSNPEII